MSVGLWHGDPKESIFRSLDDLRSVSDDSLSNSATDLLPLDYTPLRFKNIIDFCTSPDGLNLTTIYQFCRQYQILRDLYGLLCPNCTPKRNPMPICEICDPEELKIPAMPTTSYDCWGLTEMQIKAEALFENIGGVMKCPKCDMLQKDANWPTYNTVIGCAGMRSGKSAVAAEILLWELHNDLMLENPQLAWGLLPGQEVRYTVAATTDTQAQSTTYSQVDGLLDHAPWFVKYIAALKVAARANNRPIDSVFVKGVTEIKFLHKQLFIDLAGSNSASAAGKTRRLVVIDEVARFTETQTRVGVDMVYATLLNSLLTLAGFGSKMICISSPMYKGDKIMDLHNKAIQGMAEKGPTTDLLFHLPTWRMNPKLPRSHAFIEKQFRDNPLDAKRDFGADPPGATHPWIPEIKFIDDCVDENAPCLVTGLRDEICMASVGGMITRRIRKTLESAILDYTTTKHIVIACDPAYRHDSFGMLLAYTGPVKKPTGVEEHVFVGAVLEWRPEERTGTEVDFRNALECVRRFCEHWIVDIVVYDQWSSAPIIQDLHDGNIKAKQVPLKNDDWLMLASRIYGNTIHLLHPDRGGPAAAKLVTELKNLESKNGRVDHSARSSSDLAVCLARAVKMLAKPEMLETKALDAAASRLGRVIHFRR